VCPLISNIAILYHVNNQLATKGLWGFADNSVPTIMDKSIGTLLRFWGVFQCIQAHLPPLTQQTMLDACIQNFLRVSTLYRVGRGRTARKFRKGCTVLTGNREMTGKYEYYSTLPRNFVQDCRLNWNFVACHVTQSSPTYLTTYHIKKTHTHIDLWDLFESESKKGTNKIHSLDSKISNLRAF